MKHRFLFSIILLALYSVQHVNAQKIYVCEGYDYEDYTIGDMLNMQLNEAKDSITIKNDTYAVADIDSILFEKPQYPCISITWDGTTASVAIDPSIKDVTASVSGGHVKLTSATTSKEYLYVLQGTTTNGSCTITGSYKLRVNLNGVSITNPSGAAMVIDCGKRNEVKLMKGTENTFVDGKGHTLKGAFHSEGHLEIKGKGTLNVTGNTKHALYTKEYLKIKSSTGVINILGAVNDGIHCGKGEKNSEHSQLIINGGTINVTNCKKDCIDADDYGSMFINDGTINLTVNQTDGAGLSCDSIIYMTGGEINLDVSGTISQGIHTNYDGYYKGGTITGVISGNGCKGFKSKKSTTSATVKNGGDAHFQGTDVTLTLTGGYYAATATKCGGIRVDKDFYHSAGTIHITVQNSTAMPIEVKGTESKTGGTIIED